MFNLSSNFQGKPKGKEKAEWRLFNAKDFQSVMFPCFMFCRILGIFPYKINGSTFEASKLHYILWTVIICVYGIYSLTKLNNLSIFGKIDMEILPSTLANYCVFVFGSFIMVVTFILSNPRMRLLQILLKISSRLSAESHRKLSRLIHTKDIIGFFYVLGIMLIRVFTRRMFFFIPYMYLIMVIFQMDMLYINCICILKFCLKRINDNLAHMRKLMINNNSHGCKAIFHKQKNSFLIMELKDLKKQHLTISNTIQTLNMIFSLQLLATIVVSFVDITIILYYCKLYWQTFLLETTLKKKLYHMLILLRMVYHIVKIALIVWACETGKNEALQITTSIHDILNNITDEQTKNEVK